MAQNYTYDVIHRWEGNPMLSIEDPRITEIDGTFYIMYTAVSNPFSTHALKVNPFGKLAIGSYLILESLST